jgi:LAO/AO transport system kinase
LCRAIDDRLDGAREVLQDLHPHTGRAWIVGITGNPGAGKSTLTSSLVTAFRQLHERVGVLAVDPSSPFTGGAVLGDRIRMQVHFEDPGVFIRSVATRGALGGLSRSTTDMARAMDAWGAGVVVIETVGVGQDEIDVVRVAHTTLVVVAPGLGDDVQASKAGLLECADVFAVNKADRPGARATVTDLRGMLALGASLSAAPSSIGHGAGHGANGQVSKVATGAAADGAWSPPIVETIATRGEGTSALVEALEAHRAWALGTAAGVLRRRQRVREELLVALRAEVAAELAAELGEELDAMADRVEAREVDIHAASMALLARFRG